MSSIELIRNDLDNVDDVFALGFGSPGIHNEHDGGDEEK